MNILLIHPFLTLSDVSALQSEPLGLAYIAAYIREEYNVHILDLFAVGVKQRVSVGGKYRIGISDESEILSRVNAFSPDIIGITSNFTAYCEDSFDVARLIKRHLPEVPLILGGAHASMDSENILKEHQYIDLIVRGEGEETFKDLIDCIKNGNKYQHLDGLVFRKDGKVVVNPKRTLLKDINLLPEPARDLLDLDSYMMINSFNMAEVKDNPVLTVMTSRGCPFDCVFCSTKVVWERRWRSRTPEKVVDEMENMINKYGVKEIAIYDDQFIAKRKRVEEICDIIISRKLSISLSLPSGVSGWLLTEDLLVKMKKAGFYRLSLSIETGNEKTLKFIKKPVNLEKMFEIIKICHKLGFWVQSNFIIGFPYETRQEIEETIRYATDCNLDYALFLIAQPYAGAELYDMYTNDGKLMKSKTVDSKGSINCANYDTLHFTAKELESIRHHAQNRFIIHRMLSYLNPLVFCQTLVPKIFKTKGGFRYAWKVFRIIISEKVFHRSRFEYFYKNLGL